LPSTDTLNPQLPVGPRDHETKTFPLSSLTQAEPIPIAALSPNSEMGTVSESQFWQSHPDNTFSSQNSYCRSLKPATGRKRIVFAPASCIMRFRTPYKTMSSGGGKKGLKAFQGHYACQSQCSQESLSFPHARDDPSDKKKWNY